ncbi:MAG: PAS domain S-box protein [bacterium]
MKKNRTDRERIEFLQNELAAARKTIASLVKRSEKLSFTSMSDFTTFKIMAQLERNVELRGRELSKANKELQAAQRKLREYSANLEKMIEDRTEALQESEQKYRNLIDQSRDAIYLLYGGKFEIINRRFEELFGYTQAETSAPDFDFMNLVAPKSRGLIEDRIRKVESGEPVPPLYEFTALRRDGREIEVETSVSYIQYKGGIASQGVLRDITERKRAEEALRESEERYRSVVENSHAGILIVDDEYRFTYVNDELCRILQYPRKEIVGQDFRKFLDEESKQLVADRYIRRQRGENVPPRYEFNVVRKDGEKRRVEISSTVIKDSAGRVKSVAQILDITERKQAEEALRESEEKYRNLIDQSRDAIYLLYNGKFEIINRRFEELFGYTQEETNAPDFDFINLVAPKSRGLIEDRIGKIDRGEPVPPQYEFTAISRDGKEIEVETSVSYIRYKGTIATQGILRDITERVRLQEQLLQSEKLSALGELIAGVAHELNNPLTGVLGYSQLLLGAECDSKVKKSLEKIYAEATRCQKIVNNLLSFARNRKPEKRYVDVNTLIENTLELRAYEFKVSNIEVATRLDPTLPRTMADPYQIQQVFLNIINNAHQAMVEHGGRKRLAISTQSGDGLFRIEFTDTGPGIPKENLKRIFDPFFTTKKQGKSIGLGLSLCYGIIKEHGGKIYATSKMGQETTFVIELPIVEEVCPKLERSTSEKEGSAKEVKNILAVDDEQVILDLFTDVLQPLGHRVDTTRSGDAALNKIARKRYDLIFVDLKMPGMDGRQLYEHVLKDHPQQAGRMIFMTGDTVSLSTQVFLKRANARHIKKPFDIRRLKQIIETAN